MQFEYLKEKKAKVRIVDVPIGGVFVFANDYNGSYKDVRYFKVNENQFICIAGSKMGDHFYEVSDFDLADCYICKGKFVEESVG